MLAAVLIAAVAGLGLVVAFFAAWALHLLAENERLRERLARQHDDLAGLERRAADVEARIWWGRD